MQPTRCLYAFRFISYGLLCEGGDLDLDRYPILIKKTSGSSLDLNTSAVKQIRTIGLAVWSAHPKIDIAT